MYVGNLQVDDFVEILSRITGAHCETEECIWHKIDMHQSGGGGKHQSCYEHFLVVYFNISAGGRSAAQTQCQGLHRVVPLCRSSDQATFTMMEGIPESVCQTLLDPASDHALPIAHRLATLPTFANAKALLQDMADGEDVENADGEDGDADAAKQEKSDVKAASLILKAKRRPNTYISEVVQVKYQSPSGATGLVTGQATDPMVRFFVNFIPFLAYICIMLMKLHIYRGMLFMLLHALLMLLRAYATPLSGLHVTCIVIMLTPGCPHVMFCGDALNCFCNVS